MKSGKVFYDERFAGVISESEDGAYTFRYDTDYVQNYPADFLTFTMPVTIAAYTSNRLFPFFEGLIPEGWLLDIAVETWKMNPNDRMELLLTCCENCIGAVSVKRIAEEDE